MIMRSERNKSIFLCCMEMERKNFFLFDGTQYIKIWTRLVLYLKQSVLDSL